MVDCTVRRFAAGDTNSVWRVHDRALSASAMDYDPTYNRYLRHVEREFFDSGGWFAVAEAAEPDSSSDGASDPPLVGIGGFQPLEYVRGGQREPPPWLPAKEEATCRVRSVAVLPDWQGNAIGTALLGHLHARARDAGFDYVILQTYRSMEQSRRFYENLGYAVLEREDETVWYGRRVENGEQS